MKLKHYKGTLLYNANVQKITDYELLTLYNPLFIARKINYIEQYINDLYYLNQSHVTCCNVYGMVSKSYPLDKLVMFIIDQKERLNYYKELSNNRIDTVKQVLNSYDMDNQKAVMVFMKTNGKYRIDKVIDKFSVDLYQVCHKARIERNRVREKNRLISNYKRSMVPIHV